MIPLMLVYPLLIKNGWYYIGLISLPFSIFAATLIKHPLQSLYWFLSIGLLLLGLLNKNFNLALMILQPIVLTLSIRHGKKIYLRTILNAAKRNDLILKYLWKTGYISLYKRDTDEEIKFNKNLVE